jgi:RNA polymerase sigma factor (sigma-70 family)
MSAFMNVKTNTVVQAEEEDKSPDFSKEQPKVHVGEKLTEPPFDRKQWEQEVRRLSGAFRKYPDVYYATVMLQVSNVNLRMVNSEGSEIATPGASVRLVMEAQTRADDGMDLRAALAALPRDQLIMVSMFYGDDLSVEEIGAALGIPSGTVKSRLFTARQKLKALMERISA